MRYEDAVEDPTAMLGRVCAFLGLEFEPRCSGFGASPALHWRQPRNVAIDVTATGG
ncbi:MAG: hypothetical protein ACOX52_17155 [Verrucomicrobiota bacterium]